MRRMLLADNEGMRAFLILILLAALLPGCSAEDLQKAEKAQAGAIVTECRVLVSNRAVQINHLADGSAEMACGWRYPGQSPVNVYGYKHYTAAEAVGADWQCVASYSPFSVTVTRKSDGTIQYSGYNITPQDFLPGECIQYEGYPKNYISDILESAYQ
jgi:hypothetical protein